MGSGTTIFGYEAVVTGIIGSEDIGPTWAGATELAVAAAKTSSADLNDTNMKSEFSAVNRQTGASHRVRKRAIAPGVDSPSCVAPAPGSFRSDGAPRSVLSPVFPVGGQGSTRMDRFSDESFRLRDIQFN